MSIYLEDHPPARRQFYRQRKATVSGAIVMHCTDSPEDTDWDDSGAEANAAYIARRTTPGGYHELVDSDSFIQLARYKWQVFGEGTGGNRHALHLAIACRPDVWIRGTTLRWQQGALDQVAERAAVMAAWVQATHGIIVPAKRITLAGYQAHKPGFIPHSDVDPGRRTDPGRHFPWGEFFDRFNLEPETRDNEPMNLNQAMAEVAELYHLHRGKDPYEFFDYELADWREDLHKKIYQTGEDPKLTLAYINHALSIEPLDDPTD